MSWKSIFTIAKKDWREVSQNQSAWMPMLIIPVLFILAMPLGMILLIGTLPEAEQFLNDPQMAGFFQRMPEFLRVLIVGLNPAQTSILLMLGYLFAPFFLILPLMFSTVIAAESFAGERERKTIESLLYTPTTDGELFLGKMVAAGLPAVAITWISFLIYTLVVNVAAYPVMGRIWFPIASWYPLIFWISPAISVLGVAFTVLISARVQTFMGAYQSSASLVILVVGFLVGQATGVLYLNVSVGLIVGAVLWLIDGVLTTIAVRTFNRTSLLASEV